MPSVLTAKHFHDEAAAYEFIEARLWPAGPICPLCRATDRISKMMGKSTRIGVHKCYHCRKPFTVKVGTIFEASHLPMHLWLQAIYLVSSSKKGVSTHQLHRTLGVTLKTAWFLSHRIREAMRDGGLEPLGGEGQTVEADETYFGQRETANPSAQRGVRPYKNKRGIGDKNAVLGLVERGGKVRTFHVAQATKENVQKIVIETTLASSALHTDESRLYNEMHKHFASHDSVKHTAGEYVRGDVTTNTIESYFSIFKRGMRGIYQQSAEKHLHRYLSEFEFRHNHRVALGVDDVARADHILAGVVGKRLTYRTVGTR